MARVFADPDHSEVETRFPRRTAWRSAWIEDQYVVVHCPPDELAPNRVTDLAADVERANARYREYLAAHSVDELHARRQKKEERDQLRQLKRRPNL